MIHSPRSSVAGLNQRIENARAGVDPWPYCASCGYKCTENNHRVIHWYNRGKIVHKECPNEIKIEAKKDLHSKAAKSNGAFR
jgi:hypothetical protein